MKNPFGTILLAAATASLLTAGTALARFPGRGSHPKSGEITVLYPSKVANHLTLQPGNYKVELGSNTSSPQVMFYQDGKLVAQAPAKLVNEGKKSGETEVYYNTAGKQHVITQIDLRGWTQTLMFGSSNSGSKG